MSADHAAPRENGVTGTPASGRGARVPSGRFRELGLINWVAAKLGARVLRAPEMHLFTTLGQHKWLFWLFLPYTLGLLRGRLPSIDTELVILRVAHLRSSGYELQHHRQIGRKRGLDVAMQDAIFTWPDAPEGLVAPLTARQQSLLRATDEFVTDRSLSNDAWQQLSGHLDRRQLIEFCMLVGQYDALAATIAALDIPLDDPR